MKKQNYIAAIILFFALGTTLVSTAQKRNLVTPFRKGSVTVNLGVGMGVDYKGDYKYYNSGNGFGTKAALEVGVWQAGPGVVSLGAEVGGTFSNGTNKKYNDFRSRTVIVAGRSAWHYGWKVSGLDTYAGVSAGAGFHHYDYYDDHNVPNYYKNDEVIPVFGGFVGASYFFTPGFGVNVEAGYDITNIQAGVIFKLR
ncbi:MAG: hypothetical protein ABI741_03275 [Ferruginibacter sp.]